MERSSFELCLVVRKRERCPGLCGGGSRWVLYAAASVASQAPNVKLNCARAVASTNEDNLYFPKNGINKLPGAFGTNKVPRTVSEDRRSAKEGSRNPRFSLSRPSSHRCHSHGRRWRRCIRVGLNLRMVRLRMALRDTHATAESKRRAVENLVKLIGPSDESVTNENGRVAALP